jgi:hypothetical protein
VVRRDLATVRDQRAGIDAVDEVEHGSPRAADLVCGHASTVHRSANSK